MMARIASILLASLAFMLVMIVVCWPHMSALPIHCPDANHDIAIMPFAGGSTCFTLHLEGIDLFSHATFFANTLFLFLLFFLAVFGLGTLGEGFSAFSRLSILFHGPPLFVPRKQYRWFARHFALYEYMSF